MPNRGGNVEKEGETGRNGGGGGRGKAGGIRGKWGEMGRGLGGRDWGNRTGEEWKNGW